MPAGLRRLRTSSLRSKARIAKSSRSAKSSPAKAERENAAFGDETNAIKDRGICDYIFSSPVAGGLSVMSQNAKVIIATGADARRG